MSLSWKKLFLDEFVSKGHCGLCANRGRLDTRGIKTGTGFECGDVFWCICPNGRALKRQTKLAKPPVDHPTPAAGGGR